MAVERKCDYCDEPYEAKRATSRYCSDSHRALARKARSKVAEDAPPDVPARIVETTRAELQAAKREDTALGQAALLLAWRLEHSSLDTGSSVAALIKQHGATLAEAVKGAARSTDTVDQLRERREKKRRRSTTG